MSGRSRSSGGSASRRRPITARSRCSRSCPSQSRHVWLPNIRSVARDRLAPNVCGRLPSGANRSMTKHSEPSKAGSSSTRSSGALEANPPSPSSLPSISIGANKGSRAQEARICSGPTCVSRPVSNTTRSPLMTSVVQRLRRTPPRLRRSKSISSVICARSGARSYRADTSPAPAHGPGERRGRKMPGRPKTSVSSTLAWLCACRQRPASGTPNQKDATGVGSVVAVCQNCRRRATRCSGAFPAMIAAVTAPIELPRVQSGSGPPLSCNAA
jgi:hypothetical protein